MCIDFFLTASTCPALTTQASQNAEAREMNDTVVVGLTAGIAALVFIIIVVAIIIAVYRHMYVQKAFFMPHPLVEFRFALVPTP